MMGFILAVVEGLELVLGVYFVLLHKHTNKPTLLFSCSFHRISYDKYDIRPLGHDNKMFKLVALQQLPYKTFV